MEIGQGDGNTSVNRFDRMAKQYDTPQRAEVAGRITEEIRGHVVDGAARDAMDFGCGTGLVGLPLAGSFRHLLLVDPAKSMTEQVRVKIEAQGIGNASALHADLLADEAPDIRVDCIFMAQVLLHIPDTARVFAKMRGMLGEGGQLLVVDFDQNGEVPSGGGVHNGFVQSDLIALAKESGFSKAAANTFFRVENYFMGKDASLFLLDCFV